MFENDIKYLDEVMKIKNIDDLYKNYFCWLYPFTNENIDGYYSKIDFKNKNVLTVTSSGDHILNAIVYGAKNIDAFDTNPLAKYYAELKIASTKVLSYEEFILFFYNADKKSKYFLNQNMYNKLSASLSEGTKKFWDYFFSKYTIKEITNSFLFTTDHLKLNKLIKVNKYMNELYFNKLKEQLNDVKINYYDISFENLNKLDKKYEILIFSNILAFIDINKEENVFKIKNIINEITYDNSNVVMAYLYATSLNSYADEGFYDKKLVNKYFPKKDYKYLYFTSSDIINYPKLLKKIYNKEDYIIVTKTNRVFK